MTGVFFSNLCALCPSRWQKEYVELISNPTRASPSYRRAFAPAARASQWSQAVALRSGRTASSASGVRVPSSPPDKSRDRSEVSSVRAGAGFTRNCDEDHEPAEPRQPAGAVANLDRRRFSAIARRGARPLGVRLIPADTHTPGVDQLNRHVLCHIRASFKIRRPLAAGSGDESLAPTRQPHTACAQRSPAPSKRAAAGLLEPRRSRRTRSSPLEATFSTSTPVDELTAAAVVTDNPISRRPRVEHSHEPSGIPKARSPRSSCRAA